MPYRNPVIPGFHPDPTVCRVGDHYYAAVSSFVYFPGVPIFRSHNLVDWTHLGNALDRRSQLDLSRTTSRAYLGVFAPTLRHHDETFWLITTVFSADGPQSFFVTATDPAGPWSDPVPVDLPGIDPDLAWAEGDCWVHASDGERILRTRLDTETGLLLDPIEPTWSGTGLQFPEAPHLFRRGVHWYLVIAEGGTERGHAVSVARGPSPTGPWESCPANPILSHRSTNEPIQNTGHADLVEAPDGSWWVMLLGTRPRGISPGFHVLGRETFLAPVTWVAGWPTIDPIQLHNPVSPPGQPAPVDQAHHDGFDSDDLDPRWVAVRRPPDEFASSTDRPGWLSLTGHADGLDSAYPAMIARRQQHERTATSVRVDPGSAREAGVTLYMDDHHHYDIVLIGDEIEVRCRVGPASSTVATAPAPAAPVELFITTVADREAPDRVVLGHADGSGRRHRLASLDGRYLSTEVAGGMTGRMIAVFAVDGTAHFCEFDYSPISTPEEHNP